MKLRSKDSESLFFVKNIVENTCWAIDPESIIGPSRASEVSARPDMIWQFAQYLAVSYQKEGVAVQVFALVPTILNFRHYGLLVDPKVNLASAPRNVFSASSWILPKGNNLEIYDICEEHKSYMVAIE
jgi:vitamin K-dependent gamma-carboxylase